MINERDRDSEERSNKWNCEGKDLTERDVVPVNRAIMWQKGVRKRGRNPRS
jgi:hypothetical protein